VRSAIEELLSASGKMLRPAFVLLASRFGTADPARIRRVAAAVEMLHMATLVHDDIIDGARLRRGVATLNATAGPRTAVLVGDWLLASAVSLIVDLGETQDARALATITARICAGEISQSSDRGVVHTSVRRYRRRIAAKTAALFSLSFYVGARESGCPEPLAAVLRRLGYCLGMGFQIIDDILDFRREGARSGKPTGNDLAQGIYTLPVILALRANDARLAHALQRPPRTRRAAARAAALVAGLGGIEAARAVAASYTRRSLCEIARLPDTETRRTLAEVTDRLLHRDH
jgi:heptaprenyl diphosphate synthase